MLHVRYSDHRENGTDLLARDAAQPIMDSVGEMPYAALRMILADSTERVRAAFSPAEHDRLWAVRRRLDPSGVFAPASRWS